MGMTGTLHQITPTQLAEFLRHPRMAYDYITAPMFANPDIMERGEKWMAEIRAKAVSFPPAFRAEVERVAGQFMAKAEAKKGPQLVKPKSEPEPERKELRLEKE